MRSSFDARLRASLSRRIALRSSFDARIALRRRLTVHGLAIRAHVSAERLRHLSTSHSDDGRDHLSTITRRTTKSCRLSADLFGGSPRSPFDDRRPTFTASILFRRSSPLITVSQPSTEELLPHHGRRSSFEYRRRTAALRQRSPFDDPGRCAPGSTTSSHPLSTMRRRAASASRSVLVFRRSRSCSAHRAFM